MERSTSRPADEEAELPVAGRAARCRSPSSVGRAVLAALAHAAPARVLDLGCGEGALLAELHEGARVHRAGRRRRVAHGCWRSPSAGCGWTGCPRGSTGRVRLLQSALTYTDDRLVGFDAAVLMEVHRARRPAPAARRRGVGVRPRPSVHSGRHHAQCGVQRPLRGHGHWFAAPPRPPVRVDPGRVRRLVRRGRRRRTATPWRSAGVGEGDTEVGCADPAGRVHPGGGVMTTLDRSRSCRLVVLSASPAPASPPSPGGTSRRPRCSRPTRSAPWSPTTRTTSRASAAAFEALHHVAGIRLRAGRLTVVDATNVQPHARAALVRIARDHDVLPVAIVLDVPEEMCWERTQQRPDRDFGRPVVTRQHRDLRRSLGSLAREGFRKVHVLRGQSEVDACRGRRTRSSSTTGGS